MKYLERRTVVYCKASKQTGRAGGGGGGGGLSSKPFMEADYIRHLRISTFETDVENFDVYGT